MAIPTDFLLTRCLGFYAGKMCITPKYLSMVIKCLSGKSALKWLNDFVAIEAKFLLSQSNLSIQEIAYKLNFPTQSSFGKYFKKQTGMSPKEYRSSEIKREYGNG